MSEHKYTKLIGTTLQGTFKLESCINLSDCDILQNGIDKIFIGDRK